MTKPSATAVTVLVVDDEAADLSMISRALEKHGFVVLKAISYSDAMAVFDLNRQAITLLIADVALPDGNGCGLALTMRKEKRDLRVLFISFAVGSEACKYYGLNLPNMHFLNKPFTETNLVRRVRKVLGSSDGFPELGIPKTFTATE